MQNILHFYHKHIFIIKRIEIIARRLVIIRHFNVIRGFLSPGCCIVSLCPKFFSSQFLRLVNGIYASIICFIAGTKWTSPHHLPKSLFLEGLVHFAARIAYHEMIISSRDSAHICVAFFMLQEELSYNIKKNSRHYRLSSSHCG